MSDERTDELPADPDALVALAEVRADAGDKSGAFRCVRRALKASEGHVARLLRLSSLLARLDCDTDAVELLARAVLAETGAPREDRLAVEVIRAMPDVADRLAADASVREAVRVVSDRHDAPMPAHLAVSARVTLTEAGWRRFVELVGG